MKETDNMASSERSLGINGEGESHNVLPEASGQIAHRYAGFMESYAFKRPLKKFLIKASNNPSVLGIGLSVIKPDDEKAFLYLLVIDTFQTRGPRGELQEEELKEFKRLASAISDLQISANDLARPVCVCPFFLNTRDKESLESIIDRIDLLLLDDPLEIGLGPKLQSNILLREVFPIERELKRG